MAWQENGIPSLVLSDRIYSAMDTLSIRVVCRLALSVSDLSVNYQHFGSISNSGSRAVGTIIKPGSAIPRGLACNTGTSLPLAFHTSELVRRSHITWAGTW